MKITIEVEDRHKLETLMDWLRDNKFLDELTVKSTDPNAVSVPESSANDGQKTGWLKLAEEVLRDDWEAPENDIWDEFYAKQNP
ncbi:hypothetical protein [Spirosoma utsteinense]|uniref:DUF2281 domain-containing protein n=1 Tax=Spirosoma utsteinense TaxID=2585773 RepID=A0ABR6WAV7_9BACT|nr:hypothetical protein [Spirosoma utsteinense]MBC3787849.1 hypothetical protein [Spirosoma utsteinense]MBC3793637.1 hypothetical protein [Spirosoma utsteinense]